MEERLTMDKAGYKNSGLYRGSGLPIHIWEQEGYNVDSMQCWNGTMANLQKPNLFQVPNNRWSRIGNHAGPGQRYNSGIYWATEEDDKLGRRDSGATNRRDREIPGTKQAGEIKSEENWSYQNEHGRGKEGYRGEA
eukprot:7824081-Heterocapsa_arctica.AAC.1